MGWGTRKYQVTPNCCEKMRASMAIVLRSELSERFGGTYQPPHWALRLAYEPELLAIGTAGELDQEKLCLAADFPSCCPFCGERLPAIRRKPRCPKVSTGTDGNYCDTCGKRNESCRCAPPWMAYEPEPTGRPLLDNLPKIPCGDCGKEAIGVVYRTSVVDVGGQKQHQFRLHKVCADCSKKEKPEEQ